MFRISKKKKEETPQEETKKEINIEEKTATTKNNLSETPKKEEKKEEKKENKKEINTLEEEEEVKTEKWTWFPTKLINPGKYDEITKENKNVMGLNEYFDGFKFDFNKGISETFSVNHCITMHSSNEVPMYSFNTSFQKSNWYLAGRADADGTVFGRWGIDYWKRFSFIFTAQATNQPETSGAAAEVNYFGNDFTTQFKWNYPSIFGISYLQSITPRLSMGCDSFYYQAQNITIWTLGARYDTSRYIATGILSSRHISATYTQKVNEKINFSSEYTVQLSPDGGLETEWILGWEYKFRSSLIRGNFKPWRISAALEEMLLPNTKFLLCSELDYSNRKFNIGVGLLMQI